MARSSFRRIALSLLAVALAVPTAAAAFERMVVFGDSNSDSGNAFVLTGEYEVRPFDPIPDAPYLIGGLRITNGPVWAEVVADELGTPESGRPVLFRPRVNSNYAIGAARARVGGTPLDLATEIGFFLALEGDAPADWLYAVFIAGNDLRDAVRDPAMEDAIIEDAVAGIVAGIAALHEAGARSFLVFNGPDVGGTPEARANGTVTRGTAISIRFNAALEGALDQLLLALQDPDDPIELLRFDVFGLFERAEADPASFGFTNVLDSCIRPDVFFRAICREPDDYLFWDFVHVTRAAHRIIGEEVLELLDEDGALLVAAD